MSKEFDLYTLEFATTTIDSHDQTNGRGTVELLEKDSAVSDESGDLYALEFSGDPSLENTTNTPEYTVESIVSQELAIVAVGQTVEIQSNNEKQEVIDFPVAIIARFEDTLSVLIEQDKCLRFSLHDMERLTQHLGSLTYEDRWYFKQYCKQHPALEYFGDNMFGLGERITPETYWPGVIETAPRIDIAELVESTVAIMASAQVYRQQYGVKNILGIVKSQGVELYTDELNEFIPALATHPQVEPLENGKFYVKHVPNDSTLQKKEKPLQPVKVYAVRKPKDISRALYEINATDEMKRTRDLAKNMADNRRRGKNRKSKGGRMKSRYQGKKQTFEQILSDSLKSAPREQGS